MAQVWKVTKAFQSTVSKTDKTPQIVQTKGGPSHKFMVQVEGQPIDGWLSVLKKIGNAVNPGDELYGEVYENEWGKPAFKRLENPNGAPQRSSAAPSATPTSNGGSIEGKLDYIISILENNAQFQGAAKRTATESNAKDSEDIDDAPIDLSAIGY